MNERWRDDALCREVDPELFFPQRGESTMPARRVCRACPVQAACLADALASAPSYDKDWGIRAGTTPNQRRKLRKQAARPLAPVIPLTAPTRRAQPRRAA